MSAACRQLLGRGKVFLTLTYRLVYGYESLIFLSPLQYLQKGEMGDIKGLLCIQ